MRFLLKYKIGAIIGGLYIPLYMLLTFFIFSCSEERGLPPLSSSFFCAAVNNLPQSIFLFMVPFVTYSMFMNSFFNYFQLNALSPFHYILFLLVYEVINIFIGSTIELLVRKLFHGKKAKSS